MTAEELAENGFNLAPGSQVYWEDPCEGVSSGYYRVVRICTEDGRVSDVSDLLQLKNNRGTTVDAFVWELK